MQRPVAATACCMRELYKYTGTLHHGSTVDARDPFLSVSSGTVQPVRDEQCWNSGVLVATLVINKLPIGAQ